MTTAFVFPGQGSQSVGMGKELGASFLAAREVFEAVDDTLGQYLSRIMFEGPEEELVLTENAQPAIMAVSVAIMRVLEKETGLRLENMACCAAGHSLGEYSAYAAAGTFSLADTARLLRVRGRAMQDAVPVGEGAMAVIIGLEVDVAEHVAAEAANGEVCDFANDNANGQVVISGSVTAVQRAIEIARGKGAKRAMLLPVSAPFHSALMEPAASVMANALFSVDMSQPCIPIVANVTAAPVSNVDDIRQLLVDQVTARVRWRESILNMGTVGIEHLVEIGHGRILTGMTRRINSKLRSTSLGSPEDLKVFLSELAERNHEMH